jgi:hypothetical protein
MSTTKIDKQLDRRTKARFPLHRELRYKLLQTNGGRVQAGSGHTLDISSAGIAFAIDREVPVDTYVELSISWPVLLHNDCPMQLIVYGRMVRSGSGRSVCSVDKYEFRTKGRVLQSPAGSDRPDSLLKHWAESTRKAGSDVARASQLLA